MPSWDRKLEVWNWLLAITPIGVAKLVTNAIMKKSANIVAMAAILPPFFSCISIWTNSY